MECCNVGHMNTRRGVPAKSLKLSAHAKAQARSKGFTAAQLVEAVERPYKVTDVTRYPGQLRYCGAGVAVVVDGREIVTVYADGVRTPLREDQMNDAAALASRRAL